MNSAKCVRLGCGAAVLWGAGLGLGLAQEGKEKHGFEGLRKSYEEEVSRTVLPLREGSRKALLGLEQGLAGKGDYAGARAVQSTTTSQPCAKPSSPTRHNLTLTRHNLTVRRHYRA